MEQEKEAEHVHDETCGHDEPARPIVRTTPKVGRNDPCPCGSGNKFKKCCMNKAAVAPSPVETPRPAAPPPAERPSRNTFDKAADKSGDFRTRPGRRRP